MSGLSECETSFHALSQHGSEAIFHRRIVFDVIRLK